ncbi:hypothetical protein LB467_03240 [Salegentibacter sp. JZCK2]|uniref:glycosyltransferase family protein n=1 Tax=Salegentibacter tibetensis TaxID=2873600 RepID=UPI001CCCB27E|nr:hypothetical protein [Salegentibacter tibetensis]MBZ9728690.1 hypothetical protein [Salegentibacter tibetensis]
MNILFLSQGKKVSDHPGWHDALLKLKNEGEISNFINIPYLGFVEENGWNAFYQRVIELCENEKFDLVYFHFFHKKDTPSPRHCIQTLKKIQNRPIVITSSGDGFSDSWMHPDYPKNFKEASRLADITFSTQMGKAADKMIKWGAKRIVYTPNSICQVRFKASEINPNTHNFDFDVVFVGSKNSSKNPFSRNFWAARKRDKLVKALYNKYENRFGLFGNGWNYSASQGPIPFNDQQEAFKRGRVVVGGNPYSYSDYYSSNRIFFEISSGIPTVELAVPRLNNVLRDKHHIYFAKDIEQLIKKIEDIFHLESVNVYKKAAIAAKDIENNHTQYHRMKFKIDTVKKFKLNNYELDVDFPFFLPEIDLEKEMKYAIKGKNQV